MRERKSNMQGDIVRMEALNAGQNIGATNYIDQDDFYPATGITENEDGDIDTIDMVYDHRENDLTSSADFFDGDYQNSYADGEEDYDDFDDDDYEDFDDEDEYDDFDDEDDYDNYDGIDPEDTEAEWGEFDGEDDIDMDESTGDYNDMPSGAFDFFDGGDPELDIDYNAFDSDTFSEVRGRRRRKSGEGRGVLRSAVERRFGEEGQERAEERREGRRASREERREGRRAKREDRQEERKERREGRKSAREEKREERQERRRSRKDERQELRSKKKLAKIGEVEARNEATRALSQQPAEDPATAQIMADLTKRSANTQPQKKGLSTGAIVGISLGALAVVGTAMFLILRKK